MTHDTENHKPKYFGRSFRIQLAIFLGIICVYLLFRPPVPWIQQVMAGYIILFWPLYFGLIWWTSRKEGQSGDEG